MQVQLLNVPYDTAVREGRMGAGPGHLLNNGLEAHLRDRGHTVTLDVVEDEAGALPAEIRTAFELNRALAERVRDAVSSDRLPIVLAGNCNSAVGTIAGVGSEATGVLWFDAHADFNTPETTLTGYLDGMGLAVLTGRCWAPIAQTIPGFEPVDERNVLLIGARDLDDGEVDLLSNSAIALLPPAEARSSLGAAIEELAERVSRVYVHLDMDVLDPSEGRANVLEVPDGLKLHEMREVLGMARDKFEIAAAAVTAYDPSFDDDGRVCRAAFDLVDALLGDG